MSRKQRLAETFVELADTLIDAAWGNGPGATPAPPRPTQPDNAVVVGVDEKSGMPALDRSRPVLPMMPGMPERTHDYARHGVTSLFAGFNIADGSVTAELHRQHRAVEFKKFLVAIDKGRAGGPGRAPRLRQPRHAQDPGAPCIQSGWLAGRSCERRASAVSPAVGV